ncbi:MAG: transposase [Candidatus Marithrix sp.]
MPNHFHGIIQILDKLQICQATVGDIIGAFKSLVTNEYIHNVKHNGWQRFNGKLWQRNYYEHIIRDEQSYLKIANYIETNPIKW